MRRWIVALIAAAGLAGTAFAVPGFVYYGTPPAHVSAYVYHGSQPDTWYHG